MDLAQFNGKKVLVFGGYGFIGSNFIRQLFEASPKAVVILMDAQTYSGNPANLNDVRASHGQPQENGESTFGALIELKGDIANTDDVKAAFVYAPDYVINFAAETHVDRSIHTGSKVFIDTNVTGVFNILEAIKKMEKPARFVQVSTDEVYGQMPNPYDVLKKYVVCDITSCPDKLTTEHYHHEAYDGMALSKKQIIDSVTMEKFTRNSPFKPNVPYSATKAAGDCLCNAYHHTWHVPVMVTHCSNNYGPYQYPEKIVPYFATRLLRGEKVPVYGDGMNIRDWIHVDDHITALAAVLVRGEPGKDYLIGADNERTNLEVTQMIIDIVLREFMGVHAPNAEEHMEFVVDRPGHDRRYAIDHSAITEELGWTPRIGRDKFRDAIRETLAWYASHREWSAEIVKRTGVANAHIDLWSSHGIK